FCVNIVCQGPGEAAAVLLRAGRVTEGAELAAARRFGESGDGRGVPGSGDTALAGSGTASSLSRAVVRDLARGPARLCQALAIARARNGADVCDPAGPLRVLARPPKPGRVISTGPRVGVRTGAEVPWRFWIEGESAVSVYRPHVPRLSART